MLIAMVHSPLKLVFNVYSILHSPLKMLYTSGLKCTHILLRFQSSVTRPFLVIYLYRFILILHSFIYLFF